MARPWRNWRSFEAAHNVLQPVAKLFREMDANAPWLQAKRLRVDFDGSSTVRVVEHGLGHKYRGGWIGDQSNSDRYYAVLTAERCVELGVDTSTHVRVRQEPTAAERTVYVWVY